METLEEIITAGRLTNATEITDLSEDYNPEDKVFSLLLIAKENGGIEDGDWIKVSAMLPYPEGQFVDVPVRVGAWQELVFKAIEADGIDLDKVEVWVSIIF